MAGVTGAPPIQADHAAPGAGSLRRRTAAGGPKPDDNDIRVLDPCHAAHDASAALPILIEQHACS